MFALDASQETVRLRRRFDDDGDEFEDDGFAFDDDEDDDDEDGDDLEEDEEFEDEEFEDFDLDEEDEEKPRRGMGGEVEQGGWDE